MIPAVTLNDWILQAQAEYDRVCGFLIALRDSRDEDPPAAKARELALPHLQRVCQIYEARLEQVEGLARGEVADAQDWRSYGGRVQDGAA